MKAYVFILEPEKKLYNKIMSLKKAAKKLVGNQLYLSDSPHLTLYLGKFINQNKVEKEFQLAVKEIKNMNKIKIEGWHIFKNDIITKKDTLVCPISRINKLRQTQKKIVERLSKQRMGVLSRYKKPHPDFSAQLKNNIKKYGFPFVGAVWIPHLSIASFRKEDFHKVWPILANECPKGTYSFKYIKMCKLNERNNRLTEIRRFTI